MAEAPVIDSHHHVWSPGRHGCVWPGPELAAIHRDVDADELPRIAAPLGIEGSVVVQSQPDARDTDHLIHLAATHASILAVVGWVDVEAHGAPARIAELAGRPKLRGLRLMLQDLEPEWALRPQVDGALAAMARQGLTLDALVRPRHLPAVAELAARHPGLRIVVDHAGKPDLVTGALDIWRADLARAAERPNVACKLSGLFTEAPAGEGARAAAPAARHVLAVFGPERTLWGSDWPVLQLSGASYAHWLESCREWVRAFAPGGVDEVFEGACRRAYRL